MVRLARGFLPSSKNYSLERVIKAQLEQSWNFFKHTILSSHMAAPAFVARVLNSEKWAFLGLGPSVIICSHKTGFLLLFFTKAIGLQLRLNVLHNVSIHLFI